jgi:hypothetical protein
MFVWEEFIVHLILMVFFNGFSLKYYVINTVFSTERDNKCQIPKFEFCLIFHPNLMQFSMATCTYGTFVHVYIATCT